MVKLTRKQFDAFCYCRDPFLRTMSKEVEWYTIEDKTVIAVIIHDFTDNDFGYVILGRDTRNMFRCIDLNTSYDTVGKARSALYSNLENYKNDGLTLYPQGDEKKPITDILKPIVPEKKWHPLFKILINEPRFEAARNLIKEIAFSYIDTDGNYIKDFQTTGFNARLWELYLHMYLYTAGFYSINEYPVPDYHVGYYGEEFFIEATTVNPSQTNATLPENQSPTPQFMSPHPSNDYMSIRFASSLCSKHQKEYCKKAPHINGKPFIIAIHDFHADGSMVWSRSALPEYLYGVRVSTTKNESGITKPSYKKIEKHIWKDKEIPSGFFYLDGTEYISAVLFSNTATLTKFNRMGKIAGLGSKNVKMIRIGSLYNPDPFVFEPIPFGIDIDSGDYEESWSDSIVIYHNPNAITPIPDSFFRDATQFWFNEEDGYYGITQPFDVLYSVTLTISTKN